MERVLKLEQTQPKAKQTAFRIVFVLLILGLFGGGISQLLRIDYQVNQFTRLGYPMYLLTIIGVAKIMAGLVLILHRWPLLTVAAYVGTFVVSVCAFISHIVSGDSFITLLNPLVLAAITIACCMMDRTIMFLKD